MENPTALLGLHNVMLNETSTMTLKAIGFRVTTTQSIDRMIEAMGIPKGGDPNIPPNNTFDVYLMDLNLGSPNGRSYEPALRVYRHIQSDVAQGNVKFLAISGNSDVVREAKLIGIPCDRLGSFNLYEFLDKSA